MFDAVHKFISQPNVSHQLNTSDCPSDSSSFHLYRNHPAKGLKNNSTYIIVVQLLTKSVQINKICSNKYNTTLLVKNLAKVLYLGFEIFSWTKVYVKVQYSWYFIGRVFSQVQTQKRNTFCGWILLCTMVSYIGTL